MNCQSRGSTLGIEPPILTTRDCSVVSRCKLARQASSEQFVNSVYSRIFAVLRGVRRCNCSCRDTGPHFGAPGLVNRIAALKIANKTLFGDLKNLAMTGIFASNNSVITTLLNDLRKPEQSRSRPTNAKARRDPAKLQNRKFNSKTSVWKFSKSSTFTMEPYTSLRNECGTKPLSPRKVRKETERAYNDQILFLEPDQAVAERITVNVGINRDLRLMEAVSRADYTVYDWPQVSCLHIACCDLPAPRALVGAHRSTNHARLCGPHFHNESNSNWPLIKTACRPMLMRRGIPRKSAVAKILIDRPVSLPWPRPARCDVCRYVLTVLYGNNVGHF
ncbi:hypothetical protein J6590_026961 [Homalodisca vitripennis]|nr:hypothetical protein J6590_026961 [Homalodisca vitripennis]